MQGNDEMIRNIVEKVETITETFTRYTVGDPYSSSRAAQSFGITERVKQLNMYAHDSRYMICTLIILRRELDEIRSSVTRDSAENRNLVGRLKDAQEISEKLKVVWTQFQDTYIKLIVRYTLLVSIKIVLTIHVGQNCTGDREQTAPRAPPAGPRGFLPC
jgi:hypothetical protein